MEYMNSTFQAAATLLPHYGASRPAAKYQMADISPAVISANPWTIFEQGWSSVLGYPASEFEFKQGFTPMSTFKEAVMAIATYYVVIFGGRELMRSRPAFKLNGLFKIHNFYLTAISGSLLLLFAQQLIPGLWRNGLYDGVCGKTGWSQQLLVLYYLNYLTKYLELIDTVFLVLKKKPLTFLHTYHHGATAMLCYTQLVGQTSVSWVPITLNLAVHVVMYWYYFQAARGIKVWFKQYITMFQITQFVLDLGFIYFASYTYYAHTYNRALPHMGSCGTPQQETAAWTGCGILSSYLVLFIMFYLSTYKKPSAKKTDNVKKHARRASKVEVPSVQESSELAAEAVRSASHAIVDAVSEESQQCFGSR